MHSSSCTRALIQEHEQSRSQIVVKNYGELKAEILGDFPRQGRAQLTIRNDQQVAKSFNVDIPAGYTAHDIQLDQEAVKHLFNTNKPNSIRVGFLSKNYSSEITQDNKERQYEDIEQDKPEIEREKDSERER